MGQFKPMVKMMTDEPSVILKLKKGGKVATKKADGGFMPMASTQPTVPARGGMLAAASPMRPSLAARRRAMNPNLLMKKGGVTAAQVEKELKQHEAKSMSKAHKKASGGEIDKAETRTTIESGVKKFAKTKMDTSHKDRAHGTGEVKEGKPAGYATGGAIPADTKKSPNKGKIVMGGTIEGNEKAYENTDMHTATKDSAHGTGGVKMSNAGGFKHGGKAKMHYKASGGSIDKKLTRTTVEGGNWENRPANSAKPGKTNTKTGEVKEANAGGFKKGGHAKKAYATGGNVIDDGKAVKYPPRIKHAPVANTMQSGTFKRGGKVKRYEDGGSSGDPIIDRETRRMNAERAAEKAENVGMRESILGAPRRAYEAVKGMFGSPTPPAGSVTKTEKSVTVTPSKKRGGKC